MEDLPGLHGGRSVGPTMQLGIADGILESCGHDRVVPVGPLLAVLMSLQQGRVGVRSTVTFRYVGHFAGFWPLSGSFRGASSGQIPRPLPRRPAPAQARWMPLQCATPPWCVR